MDCYITDSNYRYGPPTRTEYRLVVENLSSRISWQMTPWMEKEVLDNLEDDTLWRRHKPIDECYRFYKGNQKGHQYGHKSNQR
ncbi:hypothetical protein MSG28_011958 [Choristoneura fumiferana]|uniref:Uncharacterized protein n=1 Tax=Choristoneura fumiferana TaxID=7141 RepID=A0ACC0KMZ0_CHOFU|nr:hypothetical protein MSG28_011958 [Choristoneura fumiferana]